MYGYQEVTSNFPLALDVDIRSSILATLYGSEHESAKGRWIVLQKLKRDDNGNPIKSPYTYKLTGEGKDSDRGISTTRTGYLCDEVWIRAMIVPSGRLALEELESPAGNLDTERMVFITSYKDVVKIHDIFVIPKTDVEGKILSPVTKDLEYIATVPYKKTLDTGRVEFYMTVAEVQK